MMMMMMMTLNYTETRKLATENRPQVSIRVN